MIKERIAKLIDVKSIVTILFTIAVLGMGCAGKIPEALVQLYTVIISFYFGTQATKTSK